MDRERHPGKKNGTVRRILDAATEVFAERGFAGARVDEIARRAAVNKATIYYRIGDKAALYGEVLHDVLADTAKNISNNITEGQRPEEKLRTYIHNIASTVDLHSHIPSIVMQEVASGGRHFPRVVAEDFARILGMLAEIIEEGVGKGVFIPANPLIVHLMVVGPIILHNRIQSLKLKTRVLSGMPERPDGPVSGKVSEEIQTLVLKAIETEKGD